MELLDGKHLKELWNAEIREMVDEPLKRAPCNICNTPSRRSDSWAVEDLLELTRLVGALQYQNPRCLLWFRGEHQWHQRATPSACRGSDKWACFLEATRKFNKKRGEGRLFSNRGDLARWAILQHYGAPTPLLDVTTSLRIATTLAIKTVDYKKDKPLEWSRKRNKAAHLLVFATPRPLDGINIFAEAGLCLVDLVTELPSNCLRPHVQRAGFLGLTDIVAKGLDRCKKTPPDNEASLDCVRIARICITKPINFTKLKIEHVFPPASNHTTIGDDRDDMSGDYLLQALYELKVDINDFPKYYWKTTRKPG